MHAKFQHFLLSLVDLDGIHIDISPCPGMAEFDHMCPGGEHRAGVDLLPLQGTIGIEGGDPVPIHIYLNTPTVHELGIAEDELRPAKGEGSPIPKGGGVMQGIVVRSTAIECQPGAGIEPVGIRIIVGPCSGDRRIQDLNGIHINNRSAPGMSELHGVRAGWIERTGEGLLPLQGAIRVEGGHLVPVHEHFKTPPIRVLGIAEDELCPTEREPGSIPHRGGVMQGAVGRSTAIIAHP